MLRLIGLAGMDWMRERVTAELSAMMVCLLLPADHRCLVDAQRAVRFEDGSATLLVLIQITTEDQAAWLRRQGGQIIHLNPSARLASDEALWPAMARGVDVMVRGDALDMARLIRLHNSGGA